jgi:hypothetical protein
LRSPAACCAVDHDRQPRRVARGAHTNESPLSTRGTVCARSPSACMWATRQHRVNRAADNGALTIGVGAADDGTVELGVGAARTFGRRTLLADDGNTEQPADRVSCHRPVLRVRPRCRQRRWIPSAVQPREQLHGVLPQRSKRLWIDKHPRLRAHVASMRDRVQACTDVLCI